MGRVDIMGGSFDFRQFEQFTKDLERLAKENTNQLFQDAAKELAGRLLTLAIKNTPVGDYPAESGMVGGTLRRGWTSQSHEQAFHDRANKPTAKDVQAFLDTLQISYTGDAYIIEVENPADYASYVESGHRTVNHKDWVDGKFMMRESVEELKKIAPKVLERKIGRFLRECLHD